MSMWQCDNCKCLTGPSKGPCPLCGGEMTRAELARPQAKPFSEDEIKDLMEDLKIDALLRIADAVERMAQSYQSLLDERDRYKRWYEEERAANGAKTRRLSALRGVVTRMKNAG